MDNLKKIIYLSNSETIFSENAIAALITKATQRNSDTNITGFLCFKDNRFLQFLEGPINEIDKLLLKLNLDERHKILLLLENNNPQERLFFNWNMHLLDSQNVNEREISYMLYENIEMLLDKDNISKTLENLIWQSIDIVAQHHRFTKVYRHE